MNTVTTEQREMMATDPAAARAAVVRGVACDHCDRPGQYFLIDGLTTRFYCRVGYLIHIQRHGR